VFRDGHPAKPRVSKHLTALLPPKGVGLRLFLLLTGAIVAIAMAADAWRLRQERTRVLAQLQREASLVTQAIQGQVAPLLRAADDLRLVELLEDIRQAKDAECVGVYSLEGHRLRAAFEPGAADRGPDVCAPEITPQPVAETVSARWGLSGTYKPCAAGPRCQRGRPDRGWPASARHPALRPVVERRSHPGGLQRPRGV
jgi:hypothetical protein